MVASGVCHGLSIAATAAGTAHLRIASGRFAHLLPNQILGDVALPGFRCPQTLVFDAARLFLSMSTPNRGHEYRFLGQQPVPNRSKTKNQGCAAALHEIALKRAGKN